MKTLVETLNDLINEKIFEASFKGPEWRKHNYAEDVVNKLISGEPIRLGDTGNDGTFVATAEDVEKLKKLLPIPNDFPEKFSDIFGDRLKWTKIFKGDFSGYVNGPESKNKGSAFEVDYANNFRGTYQREVEDVLGLKPGTLDNYKVVHTGPGRHLRPITITPQGVVLGHAKTETIGDSVADVKLMPENGGPNINISCKSGNIVNFCNTGIVPILPMKSYEEYKKTGEFNPTKDGGALLDFFCIDKNRFCETFINYDQSNVNRRKKQEGEDIKSQFRGQKLKKLKTFVETVVGWNYLLAHNDGKGHVHYVNIETVEDVDKFVGPLKKAELYYGGTSGTAKAVVVYLEFKGISLHLTFRSSQGFVYPNEIKGRYNFL